MKCDSSSQASIWTDLLAGAETLVDRRDGGGLEAGKVVKAVREAQSEWTNGINWCGIKERRSRPPRTRARRPAL